MNGLLSRSMLGAIACFTFVWTSDVASGQSRWPTLREERAVCVRDPSCLCKARIPDVGPPVTVATSRDDLPVEHLSLDDAIRLALENSDVVRVLAGVQAVSSGATIYDPTITETTIDEQKARFDPTIQANNNFNHIDTPTFDPFAAEITGTRTDNYDLDFGLSKSIVTGGLFRVGARTTPTRLRPDAFFFDSLNPRNRSSVEMSLTQPLLRGGGIAVNVAPIVIARIDTERSYFRFKGSMQEMVRGVIDAYWSLVAARVDRWARQQQVEQSEKAYKQAKAKFDAELLDIGDVAQARLAFANFRANLVTAQANVLAREAALRNIIGLPPSYDFEVVPTSPPSTDKLPIDWHTIVGIAEERRPDLIELKLIIEADQQLLLQANNRTLPQVDAVALYRWNGLEGEMPLGGSIGSEPGRFTDWTLGVTFSVPLGLRESRAGLRRQRLVIARDRANLQQGMHSTVHILSASVRNLESLYAQYEAVREAREAARENLNVQLKEYKFDRVIFLNVLQAIASWGDAVSAEAQTLTLYNTELANLERETGTILETHGVTFVEERFRAIAPLGRLARRQCYPHSIVPTLNAGRYPATDEPAEESFNLSKPTAKRHDAKLELLPLPQIAP